MNPDNFINKLLAGEYPPRTKGIIYLVGGTILLGIILPNRSGQLENFFLRWFFQPKGIGILILAGILGYTSGALWETGSPGKRLTAGIIVSLYVIGALAGYWYLNFR